MTAKQVAAELLKTPNAEVLIRHGGDWCEVMRVAPTGVHRNGITLFAASGDFGIDRPGVMTVPSDLPAAHPEE